MEEAKEKQRIDHIELIYNKFRLLDVNHHSMHLKLIELPEQNLEINVFFSPGTLLITVDGWSSDFKCGSILEIYKN